MNLIGNARQAIGNGIVGNCKNGCPKKTQKPHSVVRNSTIICILLSNMDEQLELSLIIKGNLLQGLGGFVFFLKPTPHPPLNLKHMGHSPVTG
ncbi:hypothetical protein SAMN05192559_106166 [Halobacillus karajensis]|uniref:Uncharacterized protein n=1 Tax=Halobacillus karajensis TaxID=195088 RepID=A0A024P836_9BACI|nr:hypothetical protein [Halobacillus karajensis]CDQ21050.1 hypothetical protein BN982_03413 [Halobacillus karajensis]CDQ24886.1 hypothetical protein BN983_03185 [Halobacillus karajensis]CDQ28754.1 hypothetical protein BN981_03069 [Halobacillus karajensis]SEH96919.1 hypothetical protein SAMN05192559_106166 [Halobacillus karajensis]